MKKKADVLHIIDELKIRYPDGICSLDYPKDYELLFSVRLAAQCTDERVNLVTPALFARFPTLESLASADVTEVEEYIHSTGFFRAKARDIVAASRMLLDEYGGRVPDTMEDLLRLPGVGRKTANLILGTSTTSRGSGGGHPLYPDLRQAGSHRRHQRPGQGGAAAPGNPASGGIQRLLPPAGPPWPGGLHGAEA
jgi:hypothetical protein